MEKDPLKEGGDNEAMTTDDWRDIDDGLYLRVFGEEYFAVRTNAKSQTARCAKCDLFHHGVGMCESPKLAMPFCQALGSYYFRKTQEVRPRIGKSPPSMVTFINYTPRRGILSEPIEFNPAKSATNIESKENEND